MSFKKLLIGCALAASAASGTNALAVPIDLINDRPITPGAPGAGEQGLQYILDRVFAPGTVNAAKDQQNAGMWSSSSALYPTVTPILSFEFAANKNGNSLGFWSGADTDALMTRTIFNASANEGVRATISWDGYDYGTITRIGGRPGDVAEGAFTGISWTGFGFFLSGPGTNNNNVYTADSLNNGIAHSLAYRGAGVQGTNWAIGFEDTDGGDWDYQDFVIRVESVNPVPEPSTLALMGVALLALGSGIARRRQRSAS